MVAFFTPSGRTPIMEKIAPDRATLIPLRDWPLLQYFPLEMRVPLETVICAFRSVLLIRVLRPDIVIGNWITRLSGLYCALAGYHPFLAIAWGSDILIDAKKSRILRMLGRFTVRVADAVIVDSEVQRKAVLNLGCKSSRICCFPWGIDRERFAPGRGSEMREKLGWLHDKIVVSTRRQDQLYGVQYLIRAMPQILKKAKGSKLLLVGDGPLLASNKSLARRLGIGQQVKFLGWVDNNLLPAILNAADVYVSTSFSDGSSASLMEAMACGLPVVVTKIPANREWVIDGNNGFLVPPGNSTELANAVVRLLQNDQMRTHMRTVNLKLARKKADWKINSLVFERCVEGLIASETRHADV